MLSDEEKILCGAYKKALAGSNGEKVIEDLNFYVKRVSFEPSDPYLTAFYEGERSLALYILNMVEK